MGNAGLIKITIEKIKAKNATTQNIISPRLKVFTFPIKASLPI
jgi:hypothetical protein